MILPFLLGLPLIINSGCRNGNPVSLRDSIEGTILLETIVNPSTADVIVKVADKMTIEIPKGVVPDGTSLIVSQIDPGHWADDKDFVIQKVYEVKLGTIRSFNPPLKITMPFDPAKCPPGKFKYSINGAFLDEQYGKWRMFSNVLVDSVNNLLTIETNHLTKLSVLGYRSLWSGYTDYYQTEHFTFYWREGAISTNAEYSSPNSAEYALAGRTEPYYVLDVARWAEYCVWRYEQVNLDTWWGRVNVFFTTVVDDKGNPAPGEMTWSWLNINKRADSDPETIQGTIAHEILHIIQDNYYMVLFSSRQTLNHIKWWMEASANQADRIVWPSGRTRYDAEGSESNPINENVDKSWDDCWNDPGWYVAGGFLTYLSEYTKERKASVPELIRRVGDATDVSYVRTIIDNYLKTDLGLPKGIAHEYYDYLMAAYLKQIPIRIANAVIPDGANTWQAPYQACRIKSAGDRYTMRQCIPYMAGKIFRVYNSSATSDNIRQVKITMNSVPDDLEANLFERDIKPSDDQLKFLKTLWTNDVVTPVLAPKTPAGGKMLEIFVINKNKDARITGEPEIVFTVEAEFGSLKIVPENLNGYINESYTYVANTFGAAKPPYSVTWNFGGADIVINNDTTVTHTFAAKGVYQVKAGLLDNLGIKLASAQTSATIHSGLQVLPNPLNATLNKTHKLTASTNWIGVPRPFRLVWTFGDGTADVIVDNDSVVQHAYAAKGTYPVKVKLWDSKATLLEEANGTANVSGVMWITPDPLSGVPGTEYTFVAHTNGSGPTPYRVVWNFGDTTPDVGINNDSTAKHVFAASGTFSVTAKLYDQSNTLVMQAASVANVQGGAKPAITSIWPCSAMPDGVMEVRGTWSKTEIAPPNSSVRVNGVQAAFASGVSWRSDPLTVIVPAATVSGMAAVTVVYKGVESDARPFLIGVPTDSIRTANRIRCDFDFAVTGVKSGGGTNVFYIAPTSDGGPPPYVPVIWNSTSFSMTYTDTYTIVLTTKVEGTISDDGLSVISLKIEWTNALGDKVTAQLKPGKRIEVEPGYKASYNPNQPGVPFPYPRFLTDYDSLVSSLDVSGTCAANGESYTIQGFDATKWNKVPILFQKQ
jgi:hypothetical protein